MKSHRQPLKNLNTFIFIFLPFTLKNSRDKLNVIGIPKGYYQDLWGKRSRGLNLNMGCDKMNENSGESFPKEFISNMEDTIFFWKKLICLTIHFQ